ncbi:MAG: hypothetical protein WCX96_03805 [Bacilli bacterium]
MKTINDFKIINGVAVLEGISYADEAKVVDEYLKQNTNVLYVCVMTKDGRYFVLKNDKLIYSNEKTFTNPYYCEDSILKKTKKELEPLKDNLLEDRVLVIENSLARLNEGFSKLLLAIKNIIEDNLS